MDDSDGHHIEVLYCYEIHITRGNYVIKLKSKVTETVLKKDFLILVLKMTNLDTVVRMYSYLNYCHIPVIANAVIQYICSSSTESFNKLSISS